MADLAAVLLLASAASAAGDGAEAADHGGERRPPDRRPDEGHAAPLVRGGRGRRAGEEERLYTSDITLNTFATRDCSRSHCIPYSDKILAK